MSFFNTLRNNIISGFSALKAEVASAKSEAQTNAEDLAAIKEKLATMAAYASTVPGLLTDDVLSIEEAVKEVLAEEEAAKKLPRTTLGVLLRRFQGWLVPKLPSREKVKEDLKVHAKEFIRIVTINITVRLLLMLIFG